MGQLQIKKEEDMSKATGTMATVIVVTAVLAPGAPVNAQDPCEVVDNGSGTVTLPPAGCEYLSPDEVHEIIDALPDGTDIELAPIHRDFICHGPVGLPGPQEDCNTPGGSLGGEVETFDSTLRLRLTDNGTLGLDRVVEIPVFCLVHSGPRTAGDAVQDFDTEMVQLQGSLPGGDPDFASLQIVAGSGFDPGLASPGHTTLTRQGPPGSHFVVDSFFDISYRIDFVGTAGGVLDGASGSSQGQIRMVAQGAPSVPAVTDGGLVAMAVLAVAAGLIVQRRRRAAVA